MIEHALSVLGIHISWQLQTVALESREAGAVEALTLDSIAARRNALLEKCEEFAVGNETNAVEGVKEVVSLFTSVSIECKLLISLFRDRLSRYFSTFNSLRPPSLPLTTILTNTSPLSDSNVVKSSKLDARDMSKPRSNDSLKSSPKNETRNRRRKRRKTKMRMRTVEVTQRWKRARNGTRRRRLRKERERR
jgi:hypothetical protein